MRTIDADKIVEELVSVCKKLLEKPELKKEEQWIVSAYAAAVAMIKTAETTCPDGRFCDSRMEEETKGEKMNKQENNTDAINRTNLEIYEGGMKVEDTMTGVEGTITAWCHYYGVETDNVRITYKSDNGVIIEDWVSVSRLAVVE